MTLSFGAPPDPRYMQFKKGAQQANDDFGDQQRWRWAPGHGNWFTYAPAAWILDDVGLPDTAPSYGLDFSDDGDLRGDLWIPDLFRRLDELHTKYKSRWPDTTDRGRGGLVWTWRNGGDWRVAIPKTGGNPAPGPIPTLPPQCLKRIEDVKEYQRAGYITAVDAQNLIRNIVAECTLGP